MRLIVLVLLSFLVLTPGKPAPGETQHEMHVAASEEARDADVELDRVRGELVHYLDEEETRDLEAADRAFAAYRDAQVAFEAGQYRGGSIEPTVACATRADLTRERSRRLAEMLDELKERCERH